MSKRHRKKSLSVSAENDGNSAHFDPDIYQAAPGKKPSGKAKRKQRRHKTAYYDD